MNNFGLDKNYSQLNFEEITVDELAMVSGGTGGFSTVGITGGAFPNGGGFPSGGFPGPSPWVFFS